MDFSKPSNLRRLSHDRSRCGKRGDEEKHQKHRKRSLNYLRRAHAFTRYPQWIIVLLRYHLFSQLTPRR